MKKLGVQEFVSRATQVHGGRYDYRLVAYDGADRAVRIICPTHGEFEQRAACHLRGRGCRKCRGDKLSLLARRPVEEFLAMAVDKHGGKYGYDLSKYRNCKYPIPVTCPIHGVFMQKPEAHLRHGCNKCGIARTVEKRRANGTYSGPRHSRWIEDRGEAEFRKQMSKRCNQLVRYCLRSTGERKHGSSRQLLGYGPKDLREHIMSHPDWDAVSSGEWQVDHIFPVKAFVDHGVFDLSVINSLDNIRPISKSDNLRKKDKYDKSLFLSYLRNREITPAQTSPSSPRSTSSSSASLA